METFQVWKYPLKPGINSFEVSSRRECLSVKVQQGKPVLYIAVDPESENKQIIKINVVATGQEFYCPKRYIDTFLLENDTLVFHAFLLQ